MRAAALGQLKWLEQHLVSVCACLRLSFAGYENCTGVRNSALTMLLRRFPFSARPRTHAHTRTYALMKAFTHTQRHPELATHLSCRDVLPRIPALMFRASSLSKHEDVAFKDVLNVVRHPPDDTSKVNATL